MFDHTLQLPPLSWHRTVLEEVRRRDRVARFYCLVCLQERSDCQYKGTVEHDAENYDSLEDHPLDPAQE